MRFTKAMKTAQFFESMVALGFTYQEADKLRLIEKTLHGWAEAECGDSNDRYSRSLERDEATDKPFWVVRWHDKNKERRTPTADREKGALKRLSSIMVAHPDLVPYHQTDPRGCALYILRKSDLNGDKIDSVYTRGFGVCVD